MRLGVIATDRRENFCFAALQLCWKLSSELVKKELATGKLKVFLGE
jgi:hypothetical protein